MISFLGSIKRQLAMTLATIPKSVFCLLPLAAFVFVSSALAQEGDPDAKSLLATAVQTMEDAENSSVDLLISSKMVRDEEIDSIAQQFRYTKGPNGGFALVPIDENGQETEEGILLRGNGELTMTQVVSINRHQLEESDEGIVSFINSRLVYSVANGLGNLAFSFLSSETVSQVMPHITSAEYVGEEEVEGQSLYRCQYTMGDNLTFDAWFTKGEKPILVRVQADMSSIAKVNPSLQQLNQFEYTATFEFANWNPAADFGPNHFNYSEPTDSELVLSIVQQQTEAPNPLLGVEAPSVELNNLAGEPVNLADHLGKDVIVLDFWATWCPPCVAALPILDNVTSSMADQGVVFYAVDQGEDAETISAFLEKREISPPVLLDVEQSASTAYGVQGLPTSVLIGKDGRVQVVHVGFAQDLEAKLAKELEALVAGEDLAAKGLQEIKQKQEEQQAKLDALQKKLQARAPQN